MKLTYLKSALKRNSFNLTIVIKIPFFRALVNTKCHKNENFITIVKSKELHFNADFKYISFIKFRLTHQKLRAGENLPYFRK